MKIAAVLIVSCAVLALVKGNDEETMNMKMVKLPEDMLHEHGMTIPEARDELPAPDQMQRRGGKGKGESGPPPPPPMGWGMPPPMHGGWGQPSPMIIPIAMPSYGGHGGYGGGGYGRR